MKTACNQENTHVLRFETGENLIEMLTLHCKENHIAAAWISGLGQALSVTLAWYNIDTKSYEDNVLTDVMEISNLSGNVAVKDNQTVIHLHGTFAGSDLKAYAGHVRELVIGATCEVRLEILPGALTRAKDKETGLNLLQ